MSERWPECTSLATWTSDVMRLEGLVGASDTAQAKAFFGWLRLFSRMATGGMIQAYEGEYGRERYVLDAHKNLFVYGWGYCEASSRIDGAISVKYRYQTAAGEKEHTQVLRAADFTGGVAGYTLDAPGLVRCNSLAISR